MNKRTTGALVLGYGVIALITALMLFFSAFDKLTFDPGRIGGFIDRFVELPLGWLRVLAVYEIIACLGLLLGIWQPVVGIVSSVALIAYFVGQYFAIQFAPGPLSDWLNLERPLAPFLLSVVALALRVASTRRATSTTRTPTTRTSTTRSEHPMSHRQNT